MITCCRRINTNLKELNNGNKLAYSSKYEKSEFQCQDKRHIKKGYAYI